jgi:hypothetical protein
MTLMAANAMSFHPPSATAQATKGSAMPTQAQIIQMQRKPEARFACSACGADRGCDCNAPAVEKLAKKQEQGRQASKAYRERQKTPSYDAPVDNVEEIGKRLNAVGKPFSPQYDPNYKMRGRRTSISRLYRGGGSADWPRVQRHNAIMSAARDAVEQQLYAHECRTGVRARRVADDLIGRLFSAAIEEGLSEQDVIDAFNRRFGIKQSALAA